MSAPETRSLGEAEATASPDSAGASPSRDAEAGSAGASPSHDAEAGSAGASPSHDAEAGSAGASPSHGSAGASPSLRDLAVTFVTLVLGAAIVVFLTRYNMQIYPVWAMDDPRMVRSWEEYLLVNIAGLLFVPMLFIAAMPRESPEGFGWTRPTPASARSALLMYALMLPVLYGASRAAVFQQYYPIQPQASESLRYLVYFEVTYGLYMLAWEFFFRGFLTFGLARRLGPVAAIVLQAIAFGIMHVGKPMPEVIGSFAAGLILGWLAWRGRSFVHCFVLHWACSATFDLMVIGAKPGGLF